MTFKLLAKSFLVTVIVSFSAFGLGTAVFMLYTATVREPAIRVGPSSDGRTMIQVEQGSFYRAYATDGSNWYCAPIGVHMSPEKLFQHLPPPSGLSVFLNSEMPLPNQSFQVPTDTNWHRVSMFWTKTGGLEGWVDGQKVPVTKTSANVRYPTK